MMKVMCVFGTRPEAIKMCPLVLELKKHQEIDCVVCLTGQHREMLTQVMEAFDIKEDYNLNIMRPKQTVSTIVSDILLKMDEVIAEAKPDIVLVHGDTSTSFAAALAAFNNHVKVGHVEAGLRTFNKFSPFPEEMNRCLTARIADFHFAPTLNNYNNLKREGVENGVYVTGNTVIDSFKITVKNDYSYLDPNIDAILKNNRKIVLITAHRRENWGEPLKNICEAILELAKEYSDIDFVYPVHLNPVVREMVFPILSKQENVHLLDPLNVLDMHNLMSRSYLVMTDSGGLQEEAPSFGIPVLVLRTETERPEAVEAGTVKVVGVNKKNIIENAKELIDDSSKYNNMAHSVNPYGDGNASKRIVEHLLVNEVSITGK